LDLSNYRIYRTDHKNITIQKRRGKEWRTISYHGNSLNSLISGLFELIMAQHAPEQKDILEALVEAKLELIRSVDEVKEMIKRDCEKL
jgi:hypothetical protein